MVFAVIFAATMIGLSIKTRTTDNAESILLGNDKNIEKTFTVQPDGQLNIQTDVGNVSVKGTESNEVSIRVLARGSEDELRKFDVSFDQNGNYIEVTGKIKDGSMKGKINGGGNLIKLETSGGDIVIDPND